jgi:small subunit ribosomal protein S7
MPRHQYKRLYTKEDPIYNSLEVAKLINYVMEDGKKTIAQSIVYGAMDEIKKQGEDPLKVIYKAINNVAPNQEVKPKRLGGASYLVPIEVRQERKLYLAFNWIVDAAKGRSNKEFHSFKDKLLTELLEASKNQGTAVAKKQQAEKLAEANKAFSHLKW